MVHKTAEIANKPDIAELVDFVYILNREYLENVVVCLVIQIKSLIASISNLEKKKNFFF